MLATAGTMRLEYTVRPDGTVTDIKDLDAEVHYYSAGRVMPNACMNALRQWTYRLYLVNGQPTAMRVTIQFKFVPRRQTEITYP
ncbi:MAG: energy transducer TonB [Terracidiphilus sp.]